MKNKRRIEKALEYIDGFEKAADIGCDHCYVLINGVLSGKIKEGIGVEVVKGPFMQGKKNIEDNNLTDHIDIRLGSGLEPINIGEADVCVIGGMGGGLIKDILEKDLIKSKNFKRLILQPMSNEKELRKFLIKNGWLIVDEDILLSDKVYLYIIAEVTDNQKNYTEIDETDDIYEIGPVLINKKTKGKNEYIKEKIFKLEKVLTELEKARDRESVEKIKEDINIKIIRWRKYIENN